MGADLVADRLPPLARAVRSAGHPVIWLCDPMHGNTVTLPDGRKTRVLETLAREVREFGAALAAVGVPAAGLQLETTPDDVSECVFGGPVPPQRGGRHTTLCDPRLNPAQAQWLVAQWNGCPGGAALTGHVFESSSERRAV